MGSKRKNSGGFRPLTQLWLSNDIRVEDCPKDVLEQIKKDLTIANPIFGKAMQMKKGTWGIPKSLLYYKTVGNDVRCPIGYIDEIAALLPKALIVDERTRTFRDLDMTFTGTLRDYQQRAVDEMLQHTNGTLCAPTGIGKTALMLALIAQQNVPTIFTVHTIELANQFIASVEKFTNFTKDDVGFIGNGKKEIKPLTVALLQTLTRMDDKEIRRLNKTFEQVICDETHIVPSTTFYAAISKLSAKYKRSMSATPERADGLTPVIFWTTGPLRHSVTNAEVADVLVHPTYRQVLTDFFYPLLESSEYQTMITYLSTDKSRNQLIVDEVLKSPDSPSILLCQRKEQIQQLLRLIPGSVEMTSDMGKKARKTTMENLQSGKSHIVISTYALFSTGIDIPDMEKLYLCAPIKSKIKVKQSVGRIMRKGSVAKEPEVIDFVDKKIDLLKYQGNMRKKIIERNGK